ncbi:hypothetical protein JZ751_008998 [Albula glossodonta]|uniref:Uncharacterized protein n=1 Tax=Albula glossodonta TaxID=121402 RepID=A0A8T2P8A4_9TELE|nr:hypothetical protein JZ751_008998 [Albula glossodonta]
MTSQKDYRSLLPSFKVEKFKELAHKAVISPKGRERERERIGAQTQAGRQESCLSDSHRGLKQSPKAQTEKERNAPLSALYSVEGYRVEGLPSLCTALLAAPPPPPTIPTSPPPPHPSTHPFHVVHSAE